MAGSEWGFRFVVVPPERVITFIHRYPNSAIKGEFDMNTIATKDNPHSVLPIRTQTQDLKHIGVCRELPGFVLRR